LATGRAIGFPEAILLTPESLDRATAHLPALACLTCFGANGRRPMKG
jgi:hypothetical protein